MKSRRRKISTGTERSTASQLLGLSLFVMLLAFFIVLNAISSYEETRVRPAMESIESAFSSKISQGDDLHPSVTKSSEVSYDEGNMLERLKVLFTALIPNNESVLSQGQGVMYVRLSLEDFEAAVMAIGQNSPDSDDRTQGLKGGGFFLPKLVALLKTDELGIPYRMDILLNTRENPALLQNRKPQKFQKMMKNMSALTEKIEYAGMPQKLISVGFQKGDAGMVDLLFRRHEPFNPLGTEHEKP